MDISISAQRMRVTIALLLVIGTVLVTVTSLGAARYVPRRPIPTDMVNDYYSVSSTQ